MSQLSELFWSASLEELKRGYIEDGQSDAYLCLACGQRFERGVVYPHQEKLYEAEKFARIHVAEAHGSMFAFLLGLDKKLTGLTDLQKRLLEMFHDGLSDNDIVTELGGGSTSTIRNHRFTLRERMKQAKVFLAILELAEERTSRPIPIRRGAEGLDRRHAITEREYEDILRTCFPEGPDGPLAVFPKREKRKLAVLRHLAESFEEGRHYSEKEVNALLKPRYADYVTLRRYLIEYGFLDRLPDGSRYWVRR